jgi:hypothetical protein
MQTIKVQAGQSLFDIAVQYLGDVERVFEIADINGLMTTNEVEPGTWLVVPDLDMAKRYVVDAFSKRNLSPASITDSGIEAAALDGIDYWAIEDDFIITDDLDDGIDYWAIEMDFEVQ